MLHINYFSRIKQIKSHSKLKSIQILFFCLCFLFFLNSIHAQIYIGDKCTISFFSETKLENIDATNSITKPILSLKTGAFAIKASQNAFVFKSSFMQEHYNENYVESEKYPYATFTGKINEAIDDTKDQVNQVTITGTLNMHGVDQTRTIAGTIEVKAGKLILNSTFDVKVVDHKIKVPSLYIEKIAEVIKVTFSAELVKKQ
jgi:hypothetical protein